MPLSTYIRNGTLSRGAILASPANDVKQDKNGRTITHLVGTVEPACVSPAAIEPFGPAAAARATAPDGIRLVCLTHFRPDGIIVRSCLALTGTEC
jgi:hypothetical protein